MIHQDFGCENSPAASLTVETEDREEALAFAARAIAPMKVRYATSVGTFAFQLKATELVDTKLINHMQYIENGAAFDVQYEDTHLTLEMPVEGLTKTCVNGTIHDVTANKTAILFNPGQRAVIHDPGNIYRACSYKFDRRLLERRFRQLTGSECAGEIAFDPVLDLTSAKGREFNALALMPFASERTQYSIWNSVASAVLFEELLVNVLLTSFRHSRSAELEQDVTLTSTCAARKCEEYLEAHAEEAITIGALAQAIGVSVRSLQRTFQKKTGTTPLRRLKEIRLERARLRLLSAVEEAGVTQIALGVGFSHLGAFAADYKARFGESPSDTLRRRF